MKYPDPTLNEGTTAAGVGSELDQSPAESLFLGNILEAVLFPYPTFSQAQRESVTMIIDSIDKFMGGREEEYRTFDREGMQPAAYLEELCSMGLFGLIIPEEYEGIGLSNAGYARVLQHTSRYDASTSLTIGAHSSIGMKGLLLFGNEEQKRRYLPKLASGEMKAAFCLTEPGSGSDAASIKTTATRNADGSWSLSGEKIWITNGSFAEFFTVFARTDGEEGKLTAFLVERAFGGISSGKKEDKLGIRASATTTVTFDNVQVPDANRLGEVGKGFKVAMGILNNGRTGLGGGCVGGMKRCIELAARHAAERKQFGRPIAEFGLVKEKLARMTVLCFATESMVHWLASRIDAGATNYSVEAAMSKVLASESLWTVANEALQIAGGVGYMKEYPYERVVRDSRINLIFEGTNEILRLYIGLTGLKDAGEYLKEIGKTAGNIFNDPIKGFGVLSSYAKKRISKAFSARDGIRWVHPLLEEEGKACSYYTVWLSRAVEAVLRKHGKNIIGKQLLTKRLADTATSLFSALTVLSRVTKMIQDKGDAATKDEQRIARIYLQYTKSQMNSNLRKLERDEDALLLELADSIVQGQGYPWDVL